MRAVHALCIYWSYSIDPPPHLINNRAELLAVITVFEHFLLEAVRLVVVMDSQYVYGGASSAVRAQCNYFGVWPY